MLVLARLHRLMSLYVKYKIISMLQVFLNFEQMYPGLESRPPYMQVTKLLFLTENSLAVLLTHIVKHSTEIGTVQVQSQVLSMLEGRTID